jgi:hypothetical protein
LFHNAQPPTESPAWALDNRLRCLSTNFHCQVKCVTLLFICFFFSIFQFVRNDRHEKLCQQDPDCFTVRVFSLTWLTLTNRTATVDELAPKKYHSASIYLPRLLPAIKSQQQCASQGEIGSKEKAETSCQRVIFFVASDATTIALISRKSFSSFPALASPSATSNEPLSRFWFERDLLIHHWQHQTLCLFFPLVFVPQAY